MSTSKPSKTPVENDNFAASAYRVPFKGDFRVEDAPTTPPKNAPDKHELKKSLEQQVEELADLQQTFYAAKHHSLLLVFQAMDAAGKDSTIRAVLSGVNPAGCSVHSFKQPSSEELEHDFLWRTTCRLPARGEIGVFNRSHYEEVLAVRVHPEFLEAQKLPKRKNPDQLWEERLESIREHEKHLARSGTVILKFWLNVSREEQRQRFLARLEEPDKNWKFSEADLTERALWPKYMSAYEAALNETSRAWAPWYAIPADSKPFMRATVAGIVVETLKKLHLEFPVVSKSQHEEFKKLRKRLEKDAD